MIRDTFLFIDDADAFTVRQGGQPAMAVLIIFFRDLLYPGRQYSVGIRVGWCAIVATSRDAHENVPPRDVLEQVSVVGNELPLILDYAKVRCNAFIYNVFFHVRFIEYLLQLANSFLQGGFIGRFIAEPTLGILLFSSNTDDPKKICVCGHVEPRCCLRSEILQQLDI